ncbi:MAG TPA: TonB-dependent receptor, partial [Bacteroidia bacterium]|nr:TonB-dependent receptor [Bacteroidia bacterium]
MKKVFASFILLFTAIAAFSQRGEVRGVVFDKATGEPLIGVSVFLKETMQGAATDINGFYTINKVAAGEYTLYATYLSYDSSVMKIKVDENAVVSKSIYLTETALNIEEVVVTAERQEKTDKVNVGTTKLSQKNLQQLVTVGGEPDLVQSLQILPGVVNTGDQGGQLYIRGGAPVMNKILLDGMTIYNPFHSIGLFSVFDSDIIRNADVYSAGFGAQYGGRISAVVDVNTREGNKTRFSGKVSANPFTSKVLLEGPLKKFKEGGGSSSYIFSYKNSYLDRSSKIFYPYIDNDRLPYSFSDLYGKFSVNARNGSKFEFFGFNFTDRVNFPNSTSYKWNSNGFGTHFVAIPDATKTIVEGFISYSDYEMEQKEKDNLPRKSSINGFNVGLNFTYLMGRNDIKYGVELNGFTTDFSTFNAAGRGIAQADNNTEIAFFIRHRNVYKRWVFEPGFRLQYYASLAEASPEPRLSVKYNVNRKFRLTAAAGMYSQNLMGATSDRDVVNLFYGFLASPDGLPTSLNGRRVATNLQKSRHLVVGMEYDLTSRLDLLVEGYIKDFTQITNINRDKLFEDEPGNFDRPEYLRKDFIVETGKATGLDFRLKYEHKSLYLWFVYSLTYVDRNDGIRTYFPSFDRRHNLNFVGSYTFGKQKDWEVNARWSYGSGFPFTLTQGFYELLPFQGGISQD